MRIEEFTMLVHEHAQLWRKAALSNSPYMYDPSGLYDKQEALECSKKLIEAIRTALSEPV